MGCLKITENTGARQIGKNHFFLGHTYEKKEVPHFFCYDYYPFGLSFNSYSRAAITAQNFKFNAGSELEKMTDWYSTPFRKYDPSLGRFHGVDALADLVPGVSPSHFGMNNPINFNDPSGLTAAPVAGPVDMRSWDNLGGQGGGGNGGSNDGASAIAGSGNHWTDGLWKGLGGVGIERNARMMSTRTFTAFYNVNDNNRADLAHSAAGAYTNRMLDYFNGKLKRIEKQMKKPNDSLFPTEDEFLASAIASTGNDPSKSSIIWNNTQIDEWSLQKIDELQRSMNKLGNTVDDFFVYILTEQVGGSDFTPFDGCVQCPPANAGPERGGQGYEGYRLGLIINHLLYHRKEEDVIEFIDGDGTK